MVGTGLRAVHQWAWLPRTTMCFVLQTTWPVNADADGMACDNTDTQGGSWQPTDIGGVCAQLSSGAGADVVYVSRLD